MLNKGLQWPTDSIQYLGLTTPTKTCNTKFELFQLNFHRYCEKLASKLNLWKSRGLTLLEKITLLKTLILSKLFYKLSLLPTDIYPPFFK